MDIRITLGLLGRKYCFDVLSNLCWSGNMRFNELKNDLGCTSKQLSLLLKLLEKAGLVKPYYDRSVNLWFYHANDKADRLMDLVAKIDNL